VLVHILGEVGTFYIGLLHVNPSTCVRIFIEIGLYLTDTEHKIGWHSFHLRHGVVTDILSLSYGIEKSYLHTKWAQTKTQTTETTFYQTKAKHMIWSFYQHYCIRLKEFM